MGCALGYHRGMVSESATAEALERHDWQMIERLTRGAARSGDSGRVLLRVRALERLGRVKEALGLAEAATAKKGNAELRLERAHLLYQAGRYQESLEVAVEALRQAQPPISQRLRMVQAMALSGMGSQEEPRRLLEASVDQARAEADLALEAEATAWLALVCFRAADLAAAEAAGRRVESLLAGQRSLVLARAHRYLAIIYGVQRRYAEALEAHRRAIGLYRALNVPLGVGREQLSLGLHYLDMGESELAELYIRKGLVVAEACEDDALSSLAHSRLGTLCLARGQPEQALKHYQRDLELTRATGSPRNLAFPLRNTGRALSALERFAEAVAPLNEACANFEAVGDAVNLGITLLDRAIAEASLKGRSATNSLELVKRGRALLENNGRAQLSPYADLAEAHGRLAAGETGLAESLFDRALGAWSAQGNSARAAEACLRFGAALVRSGQARAAQATFERALTLTVRGSQPELTSALLARLDALEPEGEVLRPLRAGGLEPLLGQTAAPASAEEIVGSTAGMVELRRLISKVAPTRVPVLITGESGVGKELVARAIHGGSPRHDRPLVVVNCGAIPSELVESELFGHVRGAFTGALRDSPGKLASADGGTLFLDEVGDLPLPAQVKLLRFLQSGEIHTVGESAGRPRTVDVRVIAATNRELGPMVEQGTFRSDLLFRLNVFPLRVPALRDRVADLPALVRRVLSTDATLAELGVRGISRAALLALKSHVWPGNVRELQSALVRAAVLAQGDTITVEDLPDFASAQETAFPTLEEVEREHIRRALVRAGGNRTTAARLLGVHRNTLRKRLE